MPFGDRRPPTSFGRPPDPLEMPEGAEPVMHLGEIRAELVLTPTIDPAAMLALGQQIAKMVAEATRVGFDAGMAQALGDLERDDDGPPAEPDEDPGDLAAAVQQTRAAG